KVPGFDTRDRDENVRGFLRTETNPFATFRPAGSAVNLDRADASTLSTTVGGDFEVAGLTRLGDFSVTVKRQGDRLGLAVRATIDADEYQIELPTTAGEFVVVDPHIVIEASLVLAKT